MIMRISYVILLLGALALCGHASKTNQLHGIGHIGVTTDDLDRSTRYYTEVLGGRYLEELQPTGGALYGDEHYNQMFKKEIEDAKRLGRDPKELGVPDISSKGAYQVRWRFIVLGNSLVQLIKYERRNDSAVFEFREPRTSPAFINQPHICFWVQEDVDINKYIVAIEDKSKQLGLPTLFNRPVYVFNETDRANLPRHIRVATNRKGNFEGLSWAYFKGPSGEQLELYQTKNLTKHNFGREYCDRKSISNAFVDNYKENKYQIRAGTSGKLFGIIQFGIRTDDMERTTSYYEKVLGGKFLTGDMVGTKLNGEEVKYMLFTKEILEARRLGLDPKKDLGVAPVGVGEKGRLDLHFVLFDNFVVEPLLYTDGPTLDDPKFNPRFNWTTPAAVNNMHAGFQLHENVDFDKFLEELEKKTPKQGFSLRGMNTGPASASAGFSTVGMEGYKYAYVKGPSGEQLVFTQFTGKSKAILKAALLDYTALSTAFPETDPFVTGSMNKFCSQYPKPSPVNSGQERLFQINSLLICALSYFFFKCL